jgi:hypothetical protein
MWYVYIIRSVSLGDPAAKDMLASLDGGGQDKTAQ